MKIRNGFVSNSSSSSFAIVGKSYYRSEFEKLLFQLLTEEEQMEYEQEPSEFQYSDKGREIFEGLDLEFDWEGDTFYVGESPRATEETKQRIAEAMKHFDPGTTSKDISFISESIYC